MKDIAKQARRLKAANGWNKRRDGIDSPKARRNSRIMAAAKNSRTARGFTSRISVKGMNEKRTIRTATAGVVGG